VYSISPARTKNTGVAFKAIAGVVAQMRSVDVQGAAAVFSHEKDCPAAFVGRVFRRAAAAHLEGEGVAVIVNGLTYQKILTFFDIWH
jgi:hypothetical protein